jgi:lysozyme
MPQPKNKGRAIAAVGASIALAVAVIGPWEGRELRAYRDIVGVTTICYGETRGVKMGDTKTPAECNSMLALRVAEFEREIHPCLPEELPIKTRAAMISLAYNIGSAAFCKSSIARLAQAGRLYAACDAFTLYNRAGGKVIRGLVNRRAAERDLCLKGLDEA